MDILLLLQVENINWAMFNFYLIEFFYSQNNIPLNHHRLQIRNRDIIICTCDEYFAIHFNCFALHFHSFFVTFFHPLQTSLSIIWFHKKKETSLNLPKQIFFLLQIFNFWFLVFLWILLFRNNHHHYHQNQKWQNKRNFNMKKNWLTRWW